MKRPKALIAVLVTLALGIAGAQDQPKGKSTAIHVLVEKYVRNACHFDTDAGPDYVDISTLLVLEPKEQRGRRLDLHHEQLAAFTMTNAVLWIVVRQDALRGTNQTVRLQEDDIVGKIRRIEPPAP